MISMVSPRRFWQVPLIKEMALELGRHRRTIYREIRRNTFHDRELPDYSGHFPTVSDDIAKSGGSVCYKAVWNARNSPQCGLSPMHCLRAAIVLSLIFPSSYSWAEKRVALVFCLSASAPLLTISFSPQWGRPPCRKARKMDLL